MIETQRLFLRRPMLEDFEQHERLWSEPEVYRHISGERRPREEIWRRFLQGLGTWHFFGFGYFSVLEKGSGRYLGQAGFQEAKRDITPSLEGSLEAGWVFAPWGQGQGFAQEACRAMFEWARAAHPGRRVTAIVSPENTASLRLALKLGLTQGPDVTYHDHPVTVFEGWLGEAVASP